jgi:roadblock/LC7 domain-containing protein
VQWRARVAALFLLALGSKTDLEVVIVILGALAGSIRAVNYTLYCAAVAGAVLIGMDLPHPSNLTDKGRRILSPSSASGSPSSSCSWRTCCKSTPRKRLRNHPQHRKPVPPDTGKGGLHMSASEFDQLISQDGILMAGRFGPDWTVTDHKCKGLFMESPAALQMAQSFCAAITMMFNSLAFAADSITRTGFDPSSWLPQQGWAFTGGDYSIAVHGNRFIIGESKKIKSFDELSRLLRQGKP